MKNDTTNGVLLVINAQTGIFRGLNCTNFLTPHKETLSGDVSTENTSLFRYYKGGDSDRSVVRCIKTVTFLLLHELIRICITTVKPVKAYVDLDTIVRVNTEPDI